MRKLGHRTSQIFAFVATPAYEGRLYTDYTLSLADTVAYCCNADRMGLSQLPIRTYCGIMGNGAFVELARNMFVKMFLESECTHLFFVDADLRWEPRVFAGLLLYNKPIVAGVYRRRENPENYPVVLTPDPKTGGPWMVDGGYVKCQRVPSGFLCIRRDVVEEMAEKSVKMKQPTSKDFPELPWVFATKFDEENRYVGEDFTFCDAYRALYNEEIPVWADADFIHGGFKCNFLEYLNRPNLADGAIIKTEGEGAVNSGRQDIHLNETAYQVHVGKKEDAA